MTDSDNFNVNEEVDNIVIKVVNEYNETNENCKLRRSVSVVEQECEDCNYNSDDEYEEEEYEEEEYEEVEEENNECSDYNINKIYLKHIFKYLSLSYLFMNGFYKSLIHAICPQYFKEDILELINNIYSRTNKKND